MRRNIERKYLSTEESVMELLEERQEKINMQKAGILDALNRMQEIPECNESDMKALFFVRQVLYAMKYKKRQSWPDKELRSIVNKLDKYQKALFYETLQDIENGLLEAGYETEDERH